MASACLPGASKDMEGGKLPVLDGTMSVERPVRQEPPRARVPVILWAVLVTLLCLSGFLMAAWATHKAQNTSDQTVALTGAILVDDLTNLQSRFPGYELLTNIFRGTGYWAAREPMAYYRSDLCVVSWRDAAYLVGGLSSDPANISQPVVRTNLVQYDAVFSLPPKELAPAPVPRMRHGAAVVGDKLYSFGGVNDTLGTALASMDVYDFITGTWAPGPQMVVPKSDMCFAVVNNKVYSLGGYDDNFSVLNTIEEFDPATQQWRVLPVTLLTARGDCGAAALGGSIYVMGGTAPIPNKDCGANWWECTLYLRSVELVDVAAGTVVPRADMLHRRGDFGILPTTSSRILVAGGEQNDVPLGVFRLLATPWVEEYDARDDHWTPKAPLPESAFRFAMTFAGNQTLRFGGQPNCPVVDQVNETRCLQYGLTTVLAYSDVEYPSVYVLARTTQQPSGPAL